MRHTLTRILVCVGAALCIGACGIYSFSGTSIQNDVNSIHIEYFEYKAQKVIGAGDVAQHNRLTVTVRASFTNRKYPEDDFSDKTFSAYADFDATQELDAVESALCTDIIEKIVEDIFNATVAQW